jgi:hypothetical protein
MSSETQPHILVAASSFLGICLLLITGLKVSGAGEQTFLDEITIVSMLFFLGSCVMSYASMRTPKKAQLSESIADISFMIGLLTLSVAVVAYSLGAL